MEGTNYADIKINILRQKRLIEDKVREKQKLKESLLDESEKLSEILLDAVDKGEIHIVDAYGYWGQNNGHLPIDSCIDSEFLDAKPGTELYADRRQTVLYFDWLELAAEPFPPPIQLSEWEEQLESAWDIGRYSWAVSKDGSLNYEGIFAMMRRLIANGQKGFICDW